MVPFLSKLLFFTSLLLLVIVMGVFLPQTPRASSAHLSSQADKDRLLRDTPSPRLILIGGSNTSMSLNSQLFYDSLHLNPVNTGLSASIGLVYMLDNTVPYVKAGDIIIICPEYSQFYENLSMGTEDLLRVVLDKSPSEIFRLRLDQFSNSLRYVPKYAFSKFKPTEYVVPSTANQVYLRSSFNNFGDMDSHWLLPGNTFPTLNPLIPSLYDNKVMRYLKEFQHVCEQKGARVFITFPALHENSFDQDSSEITLIEKRIRTEGFAVLGTPSRYRMPDSLRFDTPYHLIQPGVNMRTLLLAEDLKSAIAKSERIDRRD